MNALTIAPVIVLLAKHGQGAYGSQGLQAFFQEIYL